MPQTMEIAMEARELAKKATMLLESHEAVCAERYRGIDSRLSQIPNIQESISDIKGSVNRAVGAMIALSVLCTLLTIAVSAFKLIG